MKKIFTLLFATLMSMSMFGQAEYTCVFINVPAADKPGNIDIAGSFSDGSAMELLNTGWYLGEIEATQDDTFKFCDHNNKKKVLCQKVDGRWIQAIFKFGSMWQNDSWKGVPCKWIELDYTDAQSYAWMEDMPDLSSINTLTAKTNVKVAKMMRNGKVLIVRSGKTYNVMGTEVR